MNEWSAHVCFFETIKFLAAVVICEAFPRPLFRNAGAIYLNETRLYIKYAKKIF